MKNIIAVIGLILVIFGLFTFGYHRYQYTTQEKVLEIGDIKVTAPQEKSINFPPLLSGSAIIVGLVLVVVSRVKKN